MKDGHLLDSRSRIIISPESESEIEAILHHIGGAYHKIWSEDSFKIEHAREAIHETYLGGDIEKTLILAAKTYQKEAQNALLKILEEPPGNVRFIIISRAKSAILPTIRSRMPMVVRHKQRESMPLPIDPARFGLGDVMRVGQEVQRSGKEEAKKLVEELFFASVAEGVRLDEAELQQFSAAPLLLELNERPAPVITTLLLGMLKARNRAAF